MEYFESFDMDLVVTFTAVFVAGLAAVLGIWMERDPKKPPRYAWALSALILLATFVSLMQSFFDKAEQDKIKDDMARLLTTMDRLASESQDPELLELVKSELNAQSRHDPEVVERVAQRVSDEGRDAGEVLGRHLDAAEVEKVTRQGAIKAKNTEKVTEVAKTEEPKRAARATADREPTKETATAPERPAGDAPVRAGRADPAAAAAAVVPVPTPTPGVVETVAAPTPGRAVPARADAKAEPAATTEAPAPAKPVAKPTGRKPTPKKPAPKKPRGR